MNVTYGTYPTATEEQQEDLRDMTERFVLNFCAICVFKDDFASSTEALSKLTSASGLAIRPVLIDCLQSAGQPKIFTQILQILYIFARKEHLRLRAAPQGRFLSLPSRFFKWLSKRETISW